MRLMFLLVVAVFCNCKSKENPNLTSIGNPADLTVTLTSPMEPQQNPTTEYPYAVTVKDDQNKAHSTDHILPQPDKPTVMMFWLTTCNPCARELKSITQHFDQWQQTVPFHLVAMSEDREENYPAFVERIANEKWPFAAYWDFSRQFKSLMPGSLNGLPQTFIFDKHGKMTWSKRGFLPGDEAMLFEQIKEAAKS